MIPLNDFWQFIAFRPGLGATGLEWCSVFGDDLWPVMRQRMFIGDGIASSCISSGDSRPMRVVPGSGGFQLVCEATGVVESDAVPEEDVRCYRLDLRAFRDETAGALGIEPEPGTVRDAPGAFPLGDWQPVEGVTLPVYLMFPPTAKLLQVEIQRLLLSAGDGFILLVPELPRLDRATRDLIEQKKAMVLALSDVLAWDDSTLCSTQAWQTYRDAYCARHHADRMVPAPPSYEFRKTGDYWTVRFNGEFTTIKDAIGPSYVAQLLARPHRKIFAPDLLEAVTGQVGIGKVGSAGEQTDNQTLDEVKKKYLNIQAELEKAERNNDLAAQERLQRELDSLTDYLKTVKGFNGRTRKASDDADKIRRAMTQAIGRVLDSLGAEGKLPAAAQHLRNAIKTGLFMSYEPEEELHWSL